MIKFIIDFSDAKKIIITKFFTYKKNNKLVIISSSKYRCCKFLYQFIKILNIF